MRRKHISWKTHYAATLLALGDIPYTDAVKMTEDQIISLYNLDHNIYYETGDTRRDLFWNLSPMLIKAHREKTSQDLKIIAKGRRLRAKWAQQAVSMGFCNDGEPPIDERPKRRLISRGFDKTLTRGFDGKVRRRTTHGR